MLEWFLVASILLAFILMARSVFIIGIGYDAAFEMQAFQTIDSIPSGGTLSQAYDMAPITSEFYGLLTFQIASVLGELVNISVSPEEFSGYLIHHLVVSTLALIGALATGLGVATSLRSSTAGLFAAALVLFTPLWLGMGAMNYKDIPVAAGLAMLTCALILIASTQSRLGKQSLVTFVIASLGIFLALGTRAGSIALVSFIIAVTILLRLVQGLFKRNFRVLNRTLVLSLSALASAAIGLVITNPFARIDIFTWMRDSVMISREYIWIGVIRTAGQDLPSDQLPWWYAPGWLLAQLPILTTVAIGIGISTVFVISFHGRVGMVDRHTIVDMSPLLLMGWALPVVIIASGSVLYDGIRHLSFALPGIVAVAAVPMATLRPRAWRSNRAHGVRDHAIVTGSIIVLVASAFAVIRWFPYSYAFINPIAGAQKEPRAWELDYWGLSSREGIARLTTVRVDPIAVVPAAETGRVFSGTDAETANASTSATGRPHGMYVFRRWDAIFRQDWCTRLFTIERDGQILGEGGTCP